jgi:hypothetical protein
MRAQNLLSPQKLRDRRMAEYAGFDYEDVIGGTLSRFQHPSVRSSTIDRYVSHHLTIEALPPTYGVLARSQGFVTGEIRQ